jgi:hypothetical protein
MSFELLVSLTVIVSVILVSLLVWVKIKEGRIVGMFLMFFGIGLVGTVAGLSGS